MGERSWGGQGKGLEETKRTKQVLGTVAENAQEAVDLGNTLVPEVRGLSVREVGECGSGKEQGLGLGPVLLLPAVRSWAASLSLFPLCLMKLKERSHIKKGKATLNSLAPPCT